MMIVIMTLPPNRSSISELIWAAVVTDRTSPGDGAFVECHRRCHGAPADSGGARGISYRRRGNFCSPYCWAHLHSKGSSVDSTHRRG